MVTPRAVSTKPTKRIEALASRAGRGVGKFRGARAALRLTTSEHHSNSPSDWTCDTSQPAPLRFRDVHAARIGSVVQTVVLEFERVSSKICRLMEARQRVLGGRLYLHWRDGRKLRLAPDCNVCKESGAYRYPGRRVIVVGVPDRLAHLLGSSHQAHHSIW